MSFYTNVFENVFSSPIDMSLFFNRLLKIFNMSFESCDKCVGSGVPDHKRSTVRVPANCPTCSSWILHCERSTLPAVMCNRGLSQLPSTAK